MKSLYSLLAAAVVAFVGAVLFIYCGVFNVAADNPHTKPVYWLMETVRERSIVTRAKGIEVPPLTDSAMFKDGGADYNEMCTGCHLEPGGEESELALGMYPRPPNLTKVILDNPAETFWIIKHGMKMSGMPAWGITHDDQRIWAIVAFLQQLPQLTPRGYHILTAREDGDEHTHVHHHQELTPNPSPVVTSESGGSDAQSHHHEFRSPSAESASDGAR